MNKGQAKGNKSESDDYDDDFDDDKTANLNTANLSKIGGKAPVTVPVINKPATASTTKPVVATTKPGAAST